MKKHENSLYAAYLKERENIETIEESQGFICYKFEKDFCYITDIYVIPEARKSSIGENLEKKVVAIAKEKGYNKLVGSVDTEDPNFERNHKIMIARKYQVLSQKSTLIMYIKELI